MQQFLLTAVVLSALLLLAGPVGAASLQLDVAADHVCAPLDTVTASGEAPVGSRLTLSDGQGTTYAQRPVEGSFTVALTVAGALGTDRVALLGPDGAALAEAAFPVDAKSGIRTDSGDYGPMWDRLQALIYRRGPRERTLGGKRVRFYVSWLRDDTHVLKAYKYLGAAPGRAAGALPGHPDAGRHPLRLLHAGRAGARAPGGLRAPLLARRRRRGRGLQPPAGRGGRGVPGRRGRLHRLAGARGRRLDGPPAPGARARPALRHDRPAALER